MNEGLSVSDKIYQQLHTVFVYGCKSCNSTRTIHEGYCNICKERLGEDSEVMRDPVDEEFPTPYPWIPCNLALMNNFFGTAALRVRGKANHILREPEKHVYYLRICEALMFPKLEDPPSDQEGEGAKEPPNVTIPSDDDIANKDMDMDGASNDGNASDNTSTSTVTDGALNPTDNPEDFT